MKVIEREYKGYILYASSEENYQKLCSDVDSGNTNGLIRKGYQANTGSGWFDIRWEDIDGYKSQNVTVRSMDEVQQLTTPKEPEGEGWVSVNERLPNPETGVLTIDRNDGFMCIAWIDGDIGGWWDNISGSNNHITHWMPLPEPPNV